jgi:hypothetical protein
MKKLIAVIVLFVLIGAADIIYTYNSDGSLLWKLKEDSRTELTENEAPEEANEYVYERPEREPPIPEVEHRCDFVNKIDPDKYFSDSDPIIDPEYGCLVSHNVFDSSDGDELIVDVYSSQYIDGVFCGIMDTHMYNESGGGVITPCAYDSAARSALKYTYNDHFSLLLDDYNNDGNPDFTLRTGDIRKDGAFYYINYATNESYPVHHTNFETPLYNSDSAVFVYGETADSIRLDHTDMDHSFFLTKTTEGDVVPYMFSSSLRSCDYSPYAVGNRLYSAFYENGILTLKATDCDADTVMYTDAVTVNVRKYNERVWESCDSFKTSFEREIWVHKAYREVKLKKGFYQLEIVTPDGTAYAEFMVRA